MAEEKKLFIKIDEYEDINKVVILVKNKIEEAKRILGKINELKNEEDSELELWNNELDDVERKMEFIDSALFEPES